MDYDDRSGSERSTRSGLNGRDDGSDNRSVDMIDRIVGANEVPPGMRTSDDLSVDFERRSSLRSI